MLRGWITDIDLKRIFGVATKCGLPSAHALFHNKEILQNALDDTVKHRNGSQNLPVPITIGGHTFVNDLDANEIEEATILMCKFGSL
jgi:3-dehydroquinate synthase